MCFFFGKCYYNQSDRPNDIDLRFTRLTLEGIRHQASSCADEENRPIVLFLVTNCTQFWATASFRMSGTLAEYLEWNVDAVNVGGAKYKMAAVMLMDATE